MNPQERQLPSVGPQGDAQSQNATTVQIPVSDPPLVQSAADDPVQQPVASTQSNDQDLEAGDVDLIEKAWVEKAKDIVRRTQGDPYNQNKELSKIKAEYIKKRYDRDVKVSE